jgi:hypothetical protein
MRKRDVPMERAGAMKHLSLLGVIFLLFGTTACSFMSKEKPLVPLASGDFD